MRFNLIATALFLLGIVLTAVTGGQDSAADRIIFPHVFHVEDMELECGDCHGGTEGAALLTHDTLLPIMDDCLACHDGDTASEECDVCHANPDDAQTYQWLPTRGLIFPHQLHIAGDIECSQCHPDVTQAEALAPRSAPSMGQCMDCHTTPITDAGCLSCHASLQGKLPANHGIDWVEMHGLSAGSTNDDCVICHQQTDCESCHAQAQLEKQVHPANYEFAHAGDFLGFAKDCGGCHAIPQDCQNCHKSKMVMPLGHNNPTWSPRAESVWGVTGGYHAEEALDKPDYCVVCHEPAVDNTCQRCHGN